MLVNLFKVYLVTIIVLVSASISFAQYEGSSILIISDTKSRILIDGDELGVILPKKPTRFQTSSGEHYLQIVSFFSKEEKSEIVNLEAGKQKVLKFTFKKGVQEEAQIKIVVADLDFNIPGIVSASAHENFEYPTYLYAFEKGDKIVINVNMTNAKGTNVINVFSHPDGNAIYSNDTFTDLRNVNINIRERSIYGFSFASNHAFDRDARFLIERIPKSDETKNFNTKVSWQETYLVESIQKPQKFFINSGSNSTFKGGKSRVAIPIILPENTVKWYYEFSASRDEDQIESVTNALSLVSELSTLVDQSGLLGFGIDQLTQPPGSDYCDVYLIDQNNYTPFLNKNPQFLQYPEGTRENLKSGVVEIDCCHQGPIYLGLKNPDNFHGIHVVVEVAAIVKEERWVMHHQD